MEMLPRQAKYALSKRSTYGGIISQYSPIIGCRIQGMKRQIILFLLMAAFGLQAAAPQRGKDQLRKLAVGPHLDLKAIFFEFDSRMRIEDLTKDVDTEDRIKALRDILKDHQGDALAQLQLGRLLNGKKDTNAANICFSKAVEMGRRVVEQRPNDCVNLITLAEALDYLDRKEEAESLYRKATVIAPNDWRSWVGMGAFLDGRSSAAIFPKGAGNNSCAEAVTNPPSAEIMAEAQKTMTEASACFNRAELTAPTEADVFLARAIHLGYSNLLATIARAYREQGRFESKYIQSQLGGLTWFPASAIPDLQKASELKPGAYKLLGMLALIGRVSVAKDSGKAEMLPFPDLPTGSQQTILDVIKRLEGLAENDDPKIAASAQRTLCMVRMFNHEGMDKLVPGLRRAVALDPACEQSWEMLLAALLESASPDELTSCCEARLKRKDSARNHLILAKALNRQDLYDRAEQQARKALAHDANYASAGMMMIVLEIKKGSDPAIIADMFDKVGRQIVGLTDEEEKQVRAREFILNLAIVSGLSNKIPEAKACLDKVLKTNPEDEDARNILNALP